MKEKTVNIAFAFLISIVIFCRILSIFVVPDVFADEVEIINHITSLIKNQTDAQGNKFPLFPKVGAGLATYTYLYPMAILCSFVKVSATNLRIIQQILTILACFLTSFSMQILYKNKSLSKISLFVLLTLPWGFVQANRIWDPAFVPVYFSIYFFFFAILFSGKNLKGNELSVKEKNIFSVISFSFLVFLAIVYPPCRIVAVGMWIYSVLNLLKEKKIKTPQVILVVLFCTIFSLPLAIKLLDPAFNQRAMTLLVFPNGGGSII